MLRSIAAIAAAINLSAPSLPDTVVDSYAETVRDEALEHELDPLLVVAIVRNESQWQAGAVNARTQCIGLGGVCLGIFPVHMQTTMRVRLLDGAENLRVASALMESNREWCETKFKSVRVADWLAQYQGFGTRGITCGRAKVHGKWKRVPTPALTRRVLAYRAALVKRVGE